MLLALVFALPFLLFACQSAAIWLALRCGVKV
jgi:hypothetical protein